MLLFIEKILKSCVFIISKLPKSQILENSCPTYFHIPLYNLLCNMAFTLVHKLNARYRSNTYSLSAIQAPPAPGHAEDPI